MKKAYDAESADRLVPFLEATHREIRERADQVRRLENRLRLLSDGERTVSPVHAALSIHRREIREAKRELRRLGCEVEEFGPFQVLIPGADGSLEHGFAWTAGDSGVRPVETDTAA